MLTQYNLSTMYNNSKFQCKLQSKLQSFVPFTTITFGNADLRYRNALLRWQNADMRWWNAD